LKTILDQSKIYRSLHRPTEAERRHERLRIFQAFDKARRQHRKDVDKILRSRLNKITIPQKLEAFGDELENENCHDLAAEAREKLKTMIYAELARNPNVLFEAL
jgi:hypothetical protein